MGKIENLKQEADRLDIDIIGISQSRYKEEGTVSLDGSTHFSDADLWARIARQPPQRWRHLQVSRHPYPNPKPNPTPNLNPKLSWWNVREAWPGDILHR